MLMSDITKLLNKEEALRRDVEQVRSQFALEELSHNLAQRDHDMILREIENIQQLADKDKRYLETVQSIRGTLRTSLVNNQYLDKFVQAAEPTATTQDKKLTDIQTGFEKLVHQYEDSPTYHAILKEEAIEKELIDLIAQKKLETMKLEAEQEF